MKGDPKIGNVIVFLVFWISWWDETENLVSVGKNFILFKEQKYYLKNKNKDCVHFSPHGRGLKKKKQRPLRSKKKGKSERVRSLDYNVTNGYETVKPRPQSKKSQLFLFPYTILFTQPLRSGRIWHKVNFQVEFNRFEFRVFLLLD